MDTTFSQRNAGRRDHEFQVLQPQTPHQEPSAEIVTVLGWFDCSCWRLGIRRDPYEQCNISWYEVEVDLCKMTQHVDVGSSAASAPFAFSG